MCRYSKPTQELSQKNSYSSEIWYGNCIYDVYGQTVTELQMSVSGGSDGTAAVSIQFLNKHH